MIKQTLIINTDGGARGNPGPAGIGFVITSKHGQLICEHGEKIGATTNNVAEYTAVIKALEWLRKHVTKDSISKLEFLLDSNLVVNQLNGQYRIKQPHLLPLVEEINMHLQTLGIPYSFLYIPRHLNSQADQLVNQALDNQLPTF